MTSSFISRLSSKRKTDSRRDYIKPRFSSTTWVLIAVGSGLLLALIVQSYVTTLEDALESWRINAPDVLVHAFITGLFGGLIIHLIIKGDEINEIKKTLRDTLLTDPVIVEQLSKGQKENTIESLIGSLAPGESGDLLFNAMVKPYLNKYGYRSKFQYDVSFSLEEKGFRQDGSEEIIFSRTRYQWVNVDYVYATSYEYFPRKMSLAFVADEEGLEKTIGEPDFIFREGMFLEAAEWDSISRLSVPALKTFQTEFMSLELFVNGNKAELVSTSPLDRGSRGFVAEFNPKLVAQEGNQTTVEINIKFGMPYRRSVQWYLVTLPYPTNEPEIQLFQHDEQQDVAAISFITRHDKAGALVNKPLTGKKGRKVRLEGNCAFPRSGVMFVWNDPEFHKV